MMPAQICWQLRDVIGRVHLPLFFLDYTNPLGEHGCEEWIDLRELIDADYTIYDELAVSKWDGVQGRMHIMVYNSVTDTKDILLLNISKQTRIWNTLLQLASGT